MAKTPSTALYSLAGIVAVGMIVTLSSPVKAQNGRYTMTPTKDGILKLDTKTGAVSLCNRATGTWSCKSVDGDGQGTQSSQGTAGKMSELERENARLRDQLEQRKYAPESGESGKMEIPSEEDVDKAMDFMEKLLNRFKGMVEDLNKAKKDEDGVPL